jgi:hypothetical protein
MMHMLPKWLLAVALASPLLSHAQSADPLPPSTRLVGLNGTPAPTQEQFTIQTAADLVVTLTDLQSPAALGSATVVVTQNGSLVGNASFASPATSANFTLKGAVGQYSLWVFGEPGSSFSVGTYTVCVAPSSDPSNCIQSASLAGNISAPSAKADPTVSTLDIVLTVTTAGNYTVTFNDQKFPAALNVAPNLALFQGTQPVALGITSGSIYPLSPGAYTLLAIAQADQTQKAGLYGISITGPPGVAPLFDDSLPVGTLAPAQFVNSTVAQSLSLKITDFSFPTPLATGNAMVTAGGGSALGSVSLSAAATPASIAAPVGVLKMWSLATPGSGAGTYEVDLNSASASVAQLAAGVNNGSAVAFAYETPSLAAGAYQATATDFQFPAALPSLQFAVAQNGVILQQSTMATTLNITTPAAGSVVLLASSNSPTSGNGLFDVNVQSSGATPQLLYDKTQAVSLTDLFDTQTITLGASADLNVTLADLKFPAQFQDLDLVVSSGGVVIGKVIGGGTIPIQATPGSYQLTFIATPAAQQQYGMYTVSMVNTPPTVTLSASPTTVTAGAVSTLTWTSTDASSCMGGGGTFTGPQSAGSGSLGVSVAATTTYTLTCTGTGGSATQSVTVTTTTAASKSGGGGTLDIWALILLASLAAAREIRAARRVTTVFAALQG